MKMTVTFPEGRYMEGHYKDYVVRMGPSEKPWWEGPTPGAFDLFVMSMALCTASVVWAFMDARDLSMAGATIEQETILDEKVHMITRVETALTMPPGFPEKYREAAVRVAETCAVKRHILHAPKFVTKVVIADQGPKSEV